MTQVGYLTIDDGPTADFLNKIELLSSMEIPAIFFCRGDRLEERPEDAIAAIKKGYVLGNHSYSHPNFSQLTLKECFQEIKQTDEVLDKLYQEAEATRPAKLFRFPRGDKGSNLDAEKGWPDDENIRLFMQGIQNYLKRLGYDQPIFQNISYNWYKDAGLHLDKDIYWTYDTKDYLVTPIYKEESDKPTGYSNLGAVFSRMDEDVPEGCRGLNFSRSNDIIMMHDIIGIEGIFKRVIDALLAKEILFTMPIFSI